MESLPKIETPAKVIRYSFFKNILESKGFTFFTQERSYDIWKDGKGNQIEICEPCGWLRINGKMVRLLSSGFQANNGYRTLINFLFNQ